MRRTCTMEDAMRMRNGNAKQSLAGRGASLLLGGTLILLHGCNSSGSGSTSTAGGGNANGGSTAGPGSSSQPGGGTTTVSGGIPVSGGQSAIGGMGGGTTAAGGVSTSSSGGSSTTNSGGATDAGGTPPSGGVIRTGGTTTSSGGATNSGGSAKSGGAPGSRGTASAGSGGSAGSSGSPGTCSLITQGTDYPGMTLAACPSTATNVAGAVTTGGAPVTATDHGDTVTLDNGIVSIVITKASGTIATWTYSGQNLLSGGNEGGKVYWELEAGNGTYTLSVDPATNGGKQAEVRIHTTGSTNNLDVDIDYALLQGSSGFYATGILSHPTSYGAVSGGEWRANVYNGTIFDWLSVDAMRNKESCSPADLAASVAVAGAPKEVTQLTTGIYKGQYECKYSYSADVADQDAWGWSSTSQNVGMWVTKPSGEYYNGGPKKRELMCNMATGPGPNVLNMLGGSHYLDSAIDEEVAAGVALTKIYGPFFYYNNKVSAGTANAHDVLFADAIAQAKAEQAAWPYTWFKNTTVGTYVQESGRATVAGIFAITDPGAPNASPAGMWIGLVPDNGTDFQYQFFTYQFWVKTGADGSFSIPHVLPGKYALYAFGPGAAGTFKQATDVTVTAGQTQNLGTVSWTPPRTAATVWEIGVPDRDSHEFLNGAFNYSLWATSYVNYTSQFGKGVTYAVGTDDYSKVWNYSMMGATTWTVNFNMANAPTGAQGRFYLALASSDGSSLKVSANGTSIGSIAPKNATDSVVRLGSHGAFWDTELLFNANLLKAGANTFTIEQTGSGATLEWDYLRLEAD
jgi:rhamnogalacturonan endolyase